MPTLAASPARQAAQKYNFSQTNLVPSIFAHGGAGIISTPDSAYDPAYRADLVRDVTMTVREIESALRRYEVPRLSVVGLVFMEEPDDAPPYQNAYEWEPASVRVTDAEESGYVGDGDVWR